MDETEFPWVDVTKVRALPGHVLWAHFSDGCEGTLDLSDYIAAGGTMVEPLKDQAFFERVFVEEGVPMWPNHFDLDATNLYIQMREARTLKDRIEAAE
jgi:hypothetical protein